MSPDRYYRLCATDSHGRTLWYGPLGMWTADVAHARLVDGAAAAVIVRNAAGAGVRVEAVEYVSTESW